MKKIIKILSTVCLVLGSVYVLTVNAQPNNNWNHNNNSSSSSNHNNNWNNNHNNNNNWNNNWWKNQQAPNNCKIWYDGCNTCTRQRPGGQLTCTKLACYNFRQSQPYCRQYFQNNNWWSWNNGWHGGWGKNW